MIRWPSKLQTLQIVATSWLSAIPIALLLFQPVDLAQWRWVQFILEWSVLFALPGIVVGLIAMHYALHRGRGPERAMFFIIAFNVALAGAAYVYNSQFYVWRVA